MPLQRRVHLGVGVDHRQDDVRLDLVAHPGGGRRHQPFEVELVGVDEEADHRHLVVRLVGDVGQHEQALPRDVGIDARGERTAGCGLRHRRGSDHGRDERGGDRVLRASAAADRGRVQGNVVSPVWQDGGTVGPPSRAPAYAIR